MQCSHTVLVVLIMGLFAPWSKLQGFFVCSTENKRKTCTSPPKFGNCKLEVSRYYYDAQHNICRSFTYSGCGGNGNNYLHRFDCQQHCEEAIPPWRRDPPPKCQQPPKVGTCRGTIPRYYYDVRDKKCATFMFSGCEGNENNFPTFGECYATCDELAKPSLQIYPPVNPVDPPPQCKHPLDVGWCNADFPRFYYDAKTKECKPFKFGGCLGNKNNFETEEDCFWECLNNGI